ncbi:thiamine ABC transporter ATP-binding protein [Vibrio hippocampi]|uniref:Thiamine import ATP-binding protein ThiQ n=1 Tax=Vibrio hippocampi TaxID=654686 RepID=A0ABM8ZF37_9VIBR|nr:thiamine ABC transporter ATP-binding protein [Vibrio hippocampi]CAH0524542.1 Thiamine import ATP-binding protein ThiQ [Vibrio hippocampi]
MLNVENLIYYYDQTKFDFNLQVQQGEILALIGPSGAGKSTLLALIAGFCQPHSGQVEVERASIAHMMPAERPISMLFQEHNLFEHLTAYDNIALGIHPNLKLNSQQRSYVEDAAQNVGLGDLLQRLPSELSGGQKQRVALARCFVQSKPIWLLDEPFSALDPVLRKEMLSVVKALADKRGATVIMVTHHLNDAWSIASHYAYLANGQVIEQGEVEALTSEHVNPKVAEFVTAASL